MLGTIINDRYRILWVIQTDHQGTLYCTSDEWMGGAKVLLHVIKKRQAKKHTAQEIPGEKPFPDIFKHLCHPNLIPIHDWGTTKEKDPFFAYAWSEGKPLNPEKKTLSSHQILLMMTRICSGLIFLHNHGIIHGNLNPSTVFWEEKAIRLLGFRALFAFLGQGSISYLNPDYTAPEVSKGDHYDHRSDLYSLGAICFAFFTGHPPLNNLLKAQENESGLIQALEMQYEISPEISQVILRLISPSLSKRYESAHDVVGGLISIAGKKYLPHGVTQHSHTIGYFSGAFFGREKELDRLSHKVDDETCNSALVTGNSGIGKTRLLLEFAKRFQANGGVVAKGLCIKEQGLAYAPIRGIIRDLISFFENRSDGIALDVKQATILASLIPELWERASLKDVEIPAKLEYEHAKQRLNSTILDMLYSAAKVKPLLVVIEDLQWADEATRSFLNWMATLGGKRGILICASFNNKEKGNSSPTTCIQGNSVYHVNLSPLSKEDLEDLIRSILIKDYFPSQLIERIHKISKGNLFYAKSLLYYLQREKRVLSRSIDGWHINSDDAKKTHLPESLHGVIDLQINTLSDEAQQILRLAAVTGSVFWDGLLSSMSGIDRENILYALSEVSEKELIIEHKETVFDKNRTFIFTQPSIQTLFYNKIPTDQLSTYHEKAANWLKKKSLQRPDEYLGMIADHLEKADLQNDAMNYLMQAGAQVATQFANTEAINYLTRALKMAPIDARVERYTILLAREEILNDQGNRDAQFKDIRALKILAEQLDDNQRRIETMIREIHYLEIIGNFSETSKRAKALIHFSERIKNIIGLAEGYHIWGVGLWRQGAHKSAMPKLERTLALVRASNLEIVEANTLRVLGNIHRRLGDFSKSTECHEKALKFYQNNGYRSIESIQYMNIGLLYVALGEYNQARNYYTKALTLSEKIGYILTEMMTLTNWAELETLREDFESALGYAKKANIISFKINNPTFRAYATMYMGDALHGLKQYDPSIQAFKESLSLHKEQTRSFEIMKVLTSMADIAEKQGELKRCRAYIEEIVSFEKEHTLISASEPFRVYLMLYRVLCALEDERAMGILRTAHQLLEEQAKSIKEERYRKCFRENVIAHRDLIKEYYEKAGRANTDIPLQPNSQTIHIGDHEKKTKEDLEKELKGAYGTIDELKNLLSYYKKGEEALWESEKRFRSIAEYANDAIIIFDNKENIYFWNQAAQKLFGYTINQPRHRLLIALLMRKFQKAFEEEMTDGSKKGEYDKKGKTLIVNGVRNDGMEFPLEISLSKMKKENTTLFTAIGRDITKRKQVEEALENAKNKAELAHQEMKRINSRLEVAMGRSKEMTYKAELANRAKSEFLANMSHEIRTPMNAIIGMTHLTLDTDITDEQSEYLKAVQTSADNLLVIINDILDFSKIEAGHLELESIEFNLNDTLNAVTDVLAIKAHEKGLELLSHIEPNVPRYLLGDPVRLRQILLNLGGNAIKFTDKGEVFISCKVEQKDHSSAVLHFSISDTGIGIDSKKQETIFESFRQADGSTTRKYGGTGLGLSISKKLVHKMDGEIWVESEMGEGSIFHFTVKKGVSQTVVEQPADVHSVEISGKRALIVDDNDHNRMLLKKMLLKWNLFYGEASDGPSALKEMEKGYKKGSSYDVILMDAMMPAMDGFETCELIRSEKRFDECIIIMLTSMGLDGMTQRLKSLNISAHILKPIKEAELIRRIKTLFRSKEKVFESKAPLSGSKEMSAYSGRSLKILLAEDNNINQMMATRLLEKMGHQVKIADNGSDALKLVQKKPFDLILMDVQMPEMNGFDATRHIRKLDSNISQIPIIAMTAYAMKGDKEKCFSAGMNDYLAKPIEPTVLIKILAKWGQLSLSSHER